MGAARPHFLAKSVLFLCLTLAPAFLSPARADDPRKTAEPQLPVALEKAAPESVDDLKAIQRQVHKVLDKVIPCTVGLQIGNAAGSGVIITEDGYVLTAAHVSGEPDRDVVIRMPDGTRLKGKTLGHNTSIDSGLIKITKEGKYPHAEMGHSADLKKGEWCLTIGHPGGFQPGRTPVVRLGRILESTDKVIRTDCTLVGGDSGGPLFDMNGNVIGIHSRIGGTITSNYHVPIDTFRDTWDRLVASETWGSDRRGRGDGGAYLGIKSSEENKECRVSQVMPNSPAQKAGLQVDDVITGFDGKPVNSFEDLGNFLNRKKPGDKVVLEIQRGDEVLKLDVMLGRRNAD